MAQGVHYLKESPSQTVGAYIHIGVMPNYVGMHGVYSHDLGGQMINTHTKGKRIIQRQVFNGGGLPIKDAVIEIWQANADGLYNSVHETRGQADRSFSGCGHQPASVNVGSFSLETIRPGSTLYLDERQQAPHITFWIGARGINVGLHIRAYFSDMSDENAQDPLLNCINEPKRRDTLIAQKSMCSNGMAVFTFNIIVQGEGRNGFS